MGKRYDSAAYSRKASDTPPAAVIHWPPKASVTNADPRALAGVAAAVVRVLA
jgi:hypothetical protein